MITTKLGYMWSFVTQMLAMWQWNKRILSTRRVSVSTHSTSTKHSKYIVKQKSEDFVSGNFWLESECFIYKCICPVLMLPVSLDCPFLNAPSVFSNACLLKTRCMYLYLHWPFLFMKQIRTTLYNQFFNQSLGFEWGIVVQRVEKSNVLMLLH